jgi:CHAD domain-containing protein
MEIEAKYAITGPLDPEKLTALDLTPYALRSGADVRHHDLVLDTPDRAVTGSGHALRLRDESGSLILTLKGPGQVNGSIHRREEIEAPLPGPGDDGGNFDYHHWPAVIADRVGGMVGDAPLSPLVEVRVRRRTWVVERDGRQIGELALDEGEIQANGKADPVHELELELKGEGAPADLETLDRRLRLLLPLAPESRSKLQRGLALFGYHKNRPSGHTPLELAGRHAIKGYMKKLRKHEPKVRKDEDPEDVHDMRVAIRRTRSALELLEEAPVFKAKNLRAMRRRLRPLARALGAVRDLDVFLERVDTYEKEYPEHAAGLGILRGELSRRREAAREDLLDVLGSRKLERRIGEVEDFATHPVDVSHEEMPVLVRHFAGGAIWRRYEAALAFECVLPNAPPPTLHQLRITSKRLRYALEMFHDALGPAVEPLVGALVAVQDHLGALQDAVVAIQLVDALREREPDDTALAAYGHSLAARRDELRATFEPLWLRISGAPFRHELASALAGL